MGDKRFNWQQKQYKDEIEEDPEDGARELMTLISSRNSYRYSDRKL